VSLKTAPAVADGVVIPRSNDEVEAARFRPLAMTNPADVVGVEPLIAIVATLTALLETVASCNGVAETSPYALSVSVLPWQPVPEARPSTSEKLIVERKNCGFVELLTKLARGDNVIALSHAAATWTP